MPYDNLPESDWQKMDDCVDKVIADGKDKKSAIAICYSSISGKSEKALANSPLNLITGKIHQSYTVACDELLMRGYITQDERMAIGGLIGELLTQFRNRLMTDIPSLATTAVDPDDVDDVTEKSVMSALVDMVKSGIAKLKAGARHSSSDNKSLQNIHDEVVKLGASCPMMVFKEESGRYRWVLFSSTAFEDKDGEIVSTKAQEDDINELDKTGKYGVLRWWHVGKPYATVKGDWRTWVSGNGLDLGECDYSAMSGRVRVESGTFYNDEVGARFKEIAPSLSVSIGFSHPDNEPDAEGVFTHTHTFERSLLPRGKQSNHFVSIPVIVKESAMADMTDIKKQKLKELLGPLADDVIAQADHTDKEAEATGIAFKEDKKIGDMTAAELKDFVHKCVGDYMETDKSKKSEKETQLAQALDAIQLSLKGITENESTLAQAISSLATTTAANAEAIKELNGGLPRSLSSLRRTASPDNVIPEAEAKLKAPSLKQDNGFGDFLNFVTTGQNGGQNVPAG